MAKGKVIEAVIKIAGEISPTLGKSLDKTAKYLKSAEGKALVLKTAVAATASAVALAAVKGTKALADMGDQYNKTINDISMQTGAVGEELDDLADIAKDIYKSNLGESFEDVAAAAATAKRNTKLFGDDLKEVTEGALILRDVFDYDINESTRAAKALMTNFGIDGAKAMSMIAAGAQNGLDFSNELIDSVSEYSVHFKKIGLDADAMFQIFQAGADNGAWNLDKVGDAVKEFSIRAIDGSDTTIAAYDALGLNAEEMMSIFAAGGDDAKAAFKTVTSALINMDDQVARDAAGVQLFGTMWEDLGVDAVAAMAKAQDGVYDVGGAMDSIAATKNKSLSGFFEEIKRSVEVAALPAAQNLADKLYEMTPAIQAAMEAAAPYIDRLATGFANLVTGGIDFIANIDQTIAALEPYEPLIAGIATAIALYTIATKAAAVAQAIQNGVMAIGTGTAGALAAAMAAVNWPLLAIVAAIGLVVAAGVWLYKNWDLVKEKAAAFGEYIGNVWNNIKTAAGSFAESVVNAVSSAWNTLTDIITAPFKKALELISSVKNAISGAFDNVKGIGGKVAGFLGIPGFATGGFTEGISIAGEAGTEAVISFDPRYRSENLGYWAKAGLMLGVDDPAVMLSGGTTNTSTIEVGDIHFEPKITIRGNASEADIIEAIRKVYPEFVDLVEQIIFEREQEIYA